MQLCRFYIGAQIGVKRALDAQAVEAKPETVSGGCRHYWVGHFDPFFGEKVYSAMAEVFKIYIG